ncbi:MAG: hypothetical protein ACP6IS_08345 [Candidatus Asgardarchaeia archaeon]
MNRLTLKRLILLALILFPLSFYMIFNYKDFGQQPSEKYVVREVNINGTTFYLKGYAAGLVDTWNTDNGATESFPAMWSTKVEGLCRVDSILPIRKSILYRLQQVGLHLIFLSYYNGSYFKEAIVIGNAELTVDGSLELKDENNRSYSGFGYYSVTHEVNRTEISVNETQSTYNPYKAIINAILLLKNNNSLTGNFYVMNIYLIPNKYLNDDYLNFSFVWSFLIVHELDATDNMNKSSQLVFHFLFSPNSTLLAFRKFLLMSSTS